LIEYGKLHPERLVTHVLHGIDSLPEAYELMAKKGADLIKAIVLL
jgi:threonine dehydrogenase-like Zn-dependent dehydrogenase